MSDALALDHVLVIGRGGMLGRAYIELLGRLGVRCDAVDVPEIDLGDAASIARNVGRGLSAVINCAAYTAVDKAETEEDKATAINGDGVGALALRCKEVGARLVHFSTDYVFDGQATQPYRVDHPRDPINAYGRGKARGEELIERSGAQYVLARTSWLYAPWGANFVLTMRALTKSREQLNVVDDQIGRPTSSEYLAERSFGLLRAGQLGTFHISDGGEPCSWNAFTREIARQVGATCEVTRVTTEQYARIVNKPMAKRPAYSVFDLSRVEQVLGPSTPWQQNLASVLAAIERGA